jgi:hypothetical protein
MGSTVNCKENHSKTLSESGTNAGLCLVTIMILVLRKFGENFPFEIKQLNFQFSALEDIYVTPSDQWQSFLETLGKIIRDVDGPPALFAEIHRYPLRTF